MLCRVILKKDLCSGLRAVPELAKGMIPRGADLPCALGLDSLKHSHTL